MCISFCFWVSISEAQKVTTVSEVGNMSVKLGESTQSNKMSSKEHKFVVLAFLCISCLFCSLLETLHHNFLFTMYFVP